MALWDRHDRVLYLARDRLGIKPLYWAEFAGQLVFGSELKALRAEQSWLPELDRDSLVAFLRFGYHNLPRSRQASARRNPYGNGSSTSH